jgi:hypothetical protein
MDYVTITILSNQMKKLIGLITPERVRWVRTVSAVILFAPFAAIIAFADRSGPMPAILMLTVQTPLLIIYGIFMHCYKLCNEKICPACGLLNRIRMNWTVPEFCSRCGRQLPR